MATSTTTSNYGLSQYAASDPVKFLTNYNSDMLTIDGGIKTAKDSADAKVPLERTLAGLPLSANITLAQLITAGLAAGTNGNANNALKLGDKLASLFLTTDAVTTQTLTPINGWTTSGGTIYASKFGRVVYITFKDSTFSGTSGTAIAILPSGWNPNGIYVPSSEGSFTLQGNNIIVWATSISSKSATFVL